MADFTLAVALTLQHEGGYSDDDTRRAEYIARHGSDTGYRPTGEVVNRGITLKLIRSLGILKSKGPATPEDIEFVQSITEDEARDIYRMEFWDKLNLDSIKSQEVANKVFDLAVNMGQVSAARLLQDACNVTPDGIVGPLTIGRANTIDPVLLLATIRSHAADRYEQIAQSNPALASDLPGWLKRLES